MFSVDILMEAVIVACLILQQKRGGLPLARLMAATQETLVGWRVPEIHSQIRIPAIRDWDQPRIQTRSELGHEVGKRVGEVLVCPPPETVTRHDNPTTENRIISVEACQPRAFVGR
jgi:hypothetical protein